MSRNIISTGKRTISLVVLVTLIVLMGVGIVVRDHGSKPVELVFYVDKTLLPLFNDLENSFISKLEGEYDIEITVNYVTGSSGFVLSQMNLSKRGDLYGSDDYTFARLAVERGLVDPGSVRVIGYITLAILMPADSRLNIGGLKDLVENNMGLRIAIGDPSHVAAGKLAEELLNETGLWDALWEKHDVILAASASDVASLVRTGAVDAGITFDVFYLSDPSGLRMVEIEPELNVRAAPIVVASSSFTSYPSIIDSIIEYMSSEEFSSTLRKYGFKTFDDMRSSYPYMWLPTEADIVGKVGTNT